MCALSNNINDYYYVSQGKTIIPNVDDGEELLLTDVSESVWVTAPLLQQRENRSVVVEILPLFWCAFLLP
jgi:hypothetical protein